MTMAGRLLCDVYKSINIDEMYLYVDRKSGLTRVPDALLESFGKPEKLMTMVITKDKKLLRVSGAKLMKDIQLNGYYLQIPPPVVNHLENYLKRRESQE